MPTSCTSSSNPENVKSYGRIEVLRLPGRSHEELLAMSVEARAGLYAEAEAAARNRLPYGEVGRVFSDLEFDLETGEVFE